MTHQKRAKHKLTKKDNQSQCKGNTDASLKMDHRVKKNIKIKIKIKITVVIHMWKATVDIAGLL